MLRKVIIGIVAIALLVYVGMWVWYNQSIQESNEEWYKTEYVEKTLNGKVISIDEYRGNPKKVTISIKNRGDDFEVTYGVTCVSEEFKDFVKPGMSVQKDKGELVIQFCNEFKECESFELNFCGEFRI